jgi:small multidrug resistance pump
MPAITSGLIIALVGSLLFQVLGVAMLPLTEGLTRPVPTLVGALAFLIGLGLMARLVHSGVNLSLLVPLMAATVPLAAVAIGVLFFGDSASPLKVATLVAACGLIGYAGTL